MLVPSLVVALWLNYDRRSEVKSLSLTQVSVRQHTIPFNLLISNNRTCSGVTGSSLLVEGLGGVQGRLIRK